LCNAECPRQDSNLRPTAPEAVSSGPGTRTDGWSPRSARSQPPARAPWRPSKPVVNGTLMARLRGRRGVPDPRSPEATVPPCVRGESLLGGHLPRWQALDSERQPAKSVGQNQGLATWRSFVIINRSRKPRTRRCGFASQRQELAPRGGQASQDASQMRLGYLDNCYLHSWSACQEPQFDWTRTIPRSLRSRPRRCRIVSSVPGSLVC
jgi:hypothetical protein